MADLFNRWWVPGTPMPTSGMLATQFPVYEVMAIGSMWLPEDLLYSIAKFDNEPGQDPSKPARKVGIWGNEAGQQLRSWSVANRRPLLWTNNREDLLIDPTVANELIMPSLKGKITNEDI